MSARLATLIFWFIAFSLLLFNSYGLTPDSYAYVNGAINLIKNGTYAYCCNMSPITIFAPNYSLYLTPFIALGGATGIAITLANILLYGCSLYLLFRKSFTKLSNGQFVFISLIVTMIAYRYHSYVISENLLIPLFISWFVLRFTNTRLKGIGLLLLIALLEILMVGTKYSFALLLASYYATEFLLLFSKGKWLDNLRNKIPVFLFATLPGAYYLIQKKIVVGEEGRAHVISLWGGKYSFFEYAFQLLKDVQRFVFGDVFNFFAEQYNISWIVSIALIFLLFYYVNIKLDRKRLTFLIVTILIHLIVLSNLWIADEFNGRLAFWLYLILFYRSNIHLKDFSNKVRYWSFRLLIASVILINAGSIIYLHLAPKNDKAYELKYNYTFANEPVYSSEPVDPQLVEQEGKLYLKSPCYPWILNSETEND